MAGPQCRRHVSKLIAFVTHDGEGCADVGIDIMLKKNVSFDGREQKESRRSGTFASYAVELNLCRFLHPLLNGLSIHFKLY